MSWISMFEWYMYVLKCVHNCLTCCIYLMMNWCYNDLIWLNVMWTCIWWGDVIWCCLLIIVALINCCVLSIMLCILWRLHCNDFGDLLGDYLGDKACCWESFIMVYGLQSSLVCSVSVVWIQERVAGSR